MHNIKKNNIIKIIMLLSIIIFIYLICIEKIKINCFFYSITGFYCPGCGITRSLISLFKLDFYQSFRYQPLLFILYPILLPYMIYIIYVSLLNKKDQITPKIPQKLIYIFIFVLILYGILRNTQYFSFLAPTKI